MFFVVSKIAGIVLFGAPNDGARVPPGRYQVRLTVAMAAITGTYDGTVTLADQVPPTSYRLVAEGKSFNG